MSHEPQIIPDPKGYRGIRRFWTDEELRKLQGANGDDRRQILAELKQRRRELAPKSWRSDGHFARRT
jgi:hypothetical protein